MYTHVMRRGCAAACMPCIAWTHRHAAAESFSCTPLAWGQVSACWRLLHCLLAVPGQVYSKTWLPKGCCSKHTASGSISEAEGWGAESDAQHLAPFLSLHSVLPLLLADVSCVGVATALCVSAEITHPCVDTQDHPQASWPYRWPHRWNSASAAAAAGRQWQ